MQDASRTGGATIHYLPVSAHPETPEYTLAVSDSDFLTWKKGILRPGKEIEGLRGGVHSRTPHKKPRRLTPPGRKRTLSGWKLIDSSAVKLQPQAL